MRAKYAVEKYEQRATYAHGHERRRSALTTGWHRKDEQDSIEVDGDAVSGPEAGALRTGHFGVV